MFKCPAAIQPCTLDGFTEKFGSCYSEAEGVKANWVDAQDYCRAKGAHLPFINSQAESTYLLEEISYSTELDTVDIILWLVLRADAVSNWSIHSPLVEVTISPKTAPLQQLKMPFTSTSWPSYSVET